ncbi:MAG: acetylxylan esterase [Acidobacteria bacterium]|nr:acetylxylan esterase [Acidobacteriota bacterium]
MISVKKILLAGGGLLFLSGLASAQAMPGLPEMDQRATRIRHLHLPYTFQPFLTEEAWLKRAGDLRRQIEVSAGLWPPVEKSFLKARIFGKVSKGDYSIEKVFFESYPGFYVTGNLYRPLGKKGPFSGILTPHGHWAYGRLENQSLASMPGLGINLARQGHVVFAYDMLAYNDSRQVKDHRRPLDRSFSLWGIDWLGIQLWNSIRSVDFLQSLPDVDPDRIGCTGASGGGTQTFLLTAVDDRVKVSAPVNMISHYMQGGCICENQANLRLDTNNMEIGALMAPRPLLMVSASGDWTRETPRVEFPAVQSVYRLLGAGHKAQTMQSMADHNYNRESREAVYAWFGRWLLGESDASQFSEKRFRLGSPSEFLVFFGRDLPESAVTEEEMLVSLKDSYRRQIDDLRPRDSEGLSRFRELMSPALQHALAVGYPDPGDVIAVPAPSSKPGASREFHIGRVGRGDRVPAALWFPRGKRRNLTATLLVHAEGKAALEAPGGSWVRPLLARGHLVMSIDAFNTGAAKAKRDMSDPFFTTYNRTDVSNRVQDILTAIAYLESRPEVARVNLVGVGEGGLWSLLARALAPQLHRTLADVSRFSSEEDRAYLEHLYVPVLRRAGDFKTAAMLAPATRLLIHNTGESFNTDWFRQAYELAGKTGLLEIESDELPRERLLSWLTQTGP